MEKVEKQEGYIEKHCSDHYSYTKTTVYQQRAYALCPPVALSSPQSFDILSINKSQMKKSSYHLTNFTNHRQRKEFQLPLYFTPIYYNTGLS